MLGRPLTTKQQAVCDLLLQGLSNKEVARKLGLGPKTVEYHREMIYRKLGVRNVVEFVKKAIREGIVS